MKIVVSKNELSQMLQPWADTAMSGKIVTSVTTNGSTLIDIELGDKPEPVGYTPGPRRPQGLAPFTENDCFTK